MSKKTRVGDLELDTEVMYGGMIWIIRKKDDDANTVTLALKDSIKNMEFDAAETENTDEMRSNYGNNTYTLSNIKQWLNSRGKNWYEKKHPFDEAPSYVDQKGFMSRFNKNELKRIVPKSVTNDDGVCDCFYLPSQDEKDLVTGEQFDKNWVWLRTPNAANSYIVRSVGSSGALGSSGAYYGSYGVRPLCNLKSKTKMEMVNEVWNVTAKPGKQLKRFTTDDPQNNTERMLNLAYAKDGKVFLRDVDIENSCDMDLCEYISRIAKSEKGCNVSPEDVMEGGCMECDCEVAIIYWVAIQAAELRAKLQEYEDSEV